MTGPALSIHEVSKTFANGVRALDGVSLTVERGERIAILGRSGSGKSTLLRLVNGLERPTSGLVSVNGTQVTAQNARSIRRQVGMVFQQFNLVPSLSVTANVLCGRLAYRTWLTSLLFVFPESDHELAARAIDDVGLNGRNWDRVDRLSGGQQQRVAIARTLVQEASIILADEPVASLDPAISEEILSLLCEQAVRRSATLVMNLHQVDLACKYADRIVGLRMGKVVFDMPASELGKAETALLYDS